MTDPKDDPVVSGLERQRNLYKGKYRALLKLVFRTRNKLVHVTDHIKDEGDRCYFGSTNDADALRGLYSEMMSWIWDSEDETNRMKSDPYADIRKQRARADKAEATVEALTAQLDALKEENERLKVQWMPIDTAPKDGTPILAFGPEPVRDPALVVLETRWEFYGRGSMAHADFVAGKGPSGGWGWHEPVMNWGCKWTPTHWMPLPNPPATLTQPQLPDSGESVEGGE